MTSRDIYNTHNTRNTRNITCLENVAPLPMLECKKCALHETRTQVVPGRGDPTASLWFLGEAPGKEEDEQGEAFVGRAGRLLDHSLVLQKIQPERVFICNLLKCRPPKNRNPTEEEVLACLPWLIHQFTASSQPHVIVALGRFAIGVLQALTWKEILSLRVRDYAGRPFQTESGKIVVPTYHPAYILRNGGMTKVFFDHLKRARKQLPKKERDALYG